MVAYALAKYNVDAARPVIALVKVPAPVPSSVFVAKAVVGLGDVLQQMPRDVIVAPPSSVILPPLAAVAFVTDVAAVVVMVGKVATIFAVDISFWQLKEIIARRRRKRKFFMSTCCLKCSAKY